MNTDNDVGDCGSCMQLKAVCMLFWIQQHTDLEVDSDDEGCVSGNSIRKDAICDPIPLGLPQGKQGHKEAHNAVP